MLGALTSRTRVTTDALLREARFDAATGRKRHSAGEPSPSLSNGSFAITVLLFTTKIKQCVPFSPPGNCSFKLEIAFCVRGVISPVLSNLYLNEVDRMLEKAITTTRRGKYPNVQYARFADDLVVLIDSHPRHEWLMGAVEKRLREELAKLKVEINEEKSRKVDLSKGGSFGFLGFEYRRMRSFTGKWRAHYVPKLKKRTALLRKLKEIFRRYVSQPVGRVIEL